MHQAEALCAGANLSKPAVTGSVGYLKEGVCAFRVGLSAVVATAVAAVLATAPVALSRRASEEVEASRAAAGATMGPPLVASAAVCCVDSACSVQPGLSFKVIASSMFECSKLSHRQVKAMRS